MSIWSKLIGLRDGLDDDRGISPDMAAKPPYLSEIYAFIDLEVGLNDHKIHDIGALKSDDAMFHKASRKELFDFLSGVKYVCGHNIIHHDAKYLQERNTAGWILVDTLYMSPLLFPERPYHRLVKDDKLISEQMNNPVNDCMKARDLLLDEIECWNSLPHEKQTLFSSLLQGQKEFEGFLKFVNAKPQKRGIDELIRKLYEGKICQNARLDTLIKNHPCALAYALALADTAEYNSITPGWVLYNYPEVEHITKLLRFTKCKDGCDYCRDQMDVHQNLKRFFGYDNFRTYEGEPLQEKAARAAVDDKSLLAIFPTGGGKSLTFQLPALMAGRTVHGLTVVISPLQSLMKDQVDNLADRGITDAVTINGMLDPITRALAIKRVQDGDASMLYISPEMLRSKTIEKILMGRNVVRFVIDEAHCFSSWGQDFRVDYLYIGKFIKKYQEKKNRKTPIHVSCFTATAKQKVIQDICDYFKHTLDLNLELFASNASRTNLQYSVIHVEDDNEKYSRLRGLISESDCPTIVYVSRTKRTKELAEKLTRDGYKAIAFNGKMNSDEKVANQEAFMSGQVRIIVATSAFGMGVDKKDVGLVVHYDISDSLENYVQEAGRAGRDPSLSARCYVLYGDNDLDKHFILLNQTKLSISEIQQTWKAVKSLTRQRMTVDCSALEIARQAGWDDSVSDIETRVRTALATLEQSGYLSRGNNTPHVFATGITVKNVDEARDRITSSNLFSEDETEKAVRIIKSLISQKHIAKARSANAEAESRVDYLADVLGISKKDVISAIERMRQEGILADTKDMSAFIQDTGDSERKSLGIIERFANLENFILGRISDQALHSSYKQLNEDAIKSGIGTSKEKDIRTLLYFLVIKEYIHKKEDANHNIAINYRNPSDQTATRVAKRLEISRFIIKWLYRMDSANPDDNNRNGMSNAHDALKAGNANKSSKAVQFSVVKLWEEVKSNTDHLFAHAEETTLEEVEEALLYLSKIGALKLEGGFLVLYNAMNIKRLKDNKVRYKVDDYRMLNEFYKLKIQQIHIVGEYANLMVKDYNAALQYVNDYFHMDYKKFISKYFKGDRANDIERNLTPHKYDKLFGRLSARQMEIISDKESRCIVVAAGPGSGKTMVLVHKLASILTLEDVKSEQLLMLTFSRAAATEFKERLIGLIGNAAHFVEIKTFHSYCFDLLGMTGNLEDAQNVVKTAAEMIDNGDVEPNKIGKTVLVIDEAQDMGQDEYALVSALMKSNEDMRIIAVGDDDQNIYEFRGSDSSYFYSLSKERGSKLVEMTENYRCARHPVDFANGFLKKLPDRIKKSDIVSMRKENGRVEVTHHVPTHLYCPIVDDLIRHREGKSCVLTQTNEQAAIVTALLRKRGIKSKLIQSMEEVRFRNVAEMRYFTLYIQKHLSGQKIQDELWEEAKRKTFSRYDGSESLTYVKNCIEMFAKTNDSKYFNDFKEFVNESSVEDFCDLSDAEVIVSTIHKSKGREFDDVYMLIADARVERLERNGKDGRDDRDGRNDRNRGNGRNGKNGKLEINEETLRRYYVGITRAKNRLIIHTDSHCFNSLPADVHKVDTRRYALPEEIVLQLTHKDVFLDYFKDKKTEILSLKGGDALIYKDFHLLNPSTGRPVAKLSKKMKESLEEWSKKGYEVSCASVRFIVAWKSKDAAREEPESAVILADLKLCHIHESL